MDRIVTWKQALNQVRCGLGNRILESNTNSHYWDINDNVIMLSNDGNYVKSNYRRTNAEHIVVTV